MKEVRHPYRTSNQAKTPKNAWSQYPPIQPSCKQTYTQMREMNHFFFKIDVQIGTLQLGASFF